MARNDRVSKLARALRKAGLPAKEIRTSEPDLEDDSVEVTEEIHVQVCQFQGYSVSRWDGEVFHVADCTSIPAAVEAVRKAAEVAA